MTDLGSYVREKKKADSSGIGKICSCDSKSDYVSPVRAVKNQAQQGSRPSWESFVVHDIAVAATIQVLD